MKVVASRKFVPYIIEVETSEDHQDLIRTFCDAMGKYSSTTERFRDLNFFKESLAKTQNGSTHLS